MPMSASLKIGLNGPNIPGAGQQDDRKGEIPVIAATHDIKSPIGIESGLPTDSRVHKPFIITKKIDLSSPYLLQALRDNITFTTWDLRFFHMPFSGTDWNYATVKLTAARIISVKMVMPHIAMPGNAIIHEWEEIAFQYDSIGWSFHKHNSDASPGTNINDVVETDCFPGTDYFDNEAKAILKGQKQLIQSAKKVLWAEWKAKNPNKEIPAEYQ